MGLVLADDRWGVAPVLEVGLQKREQNRECDSDSLEIISRSVFWRIVKAFQQARFGDERAENMG